MIQFLNEHWFLIAVWPISLGLGFGWKFAVEWYCRRRP